MSGKKIILSKNQTPPEVIIRTAPLCLADSSSLILLYKSGLLDTWLLHYRCRITPEIFMEITCPHHTGSESFGQFFSKEQILLPHSKSELPEHLDPGEASLLRAYRHLLSRSPKQQIFLLTDDKDAARYATCQGVPFINALLVPKLLFYGDYLQEEEFEYYTTLILLKGRYSAKILSRAEKFTALDLGFFL